MTIKIINSDGSTPRTSRVRFENIETHIAARDHLASEAEILKYYDECEECENRDPVAWKWNDPTEDARFIFDADEADQLEREGAQVERIEVVWS